MYTHRSSHATIVRPRISASPYANDCAYQQVRERSLDAAVAEAGRDATAWPRGDYEQQIGNFAGYVANVNYWQLVRLTYCRFFAVCSGPGRRLNLWLVAPWWPVPLLAPASKRQISRTCHAGLFFYNVRDVTPTAFDLSWPVPRRSRWSISHKLVISIQPCLSLPNPHSTSCCCWLICP